MADLCRGSPHHLDDVQAAAQLMHYGGDLAELALATALCAMFLMRSFSGRRLSRRRAAVDRTRWDAVSASAITGVRTLP